jgi:hypothetical protein
MSIEQRATEKACWRLEVCVWEALAVGMTPEKIMAEVKRALENAEDA